MHWAWECLPDGVSAQGGVCLRVSAQGGVSQGVVDNPLWTDSRASSVLLFPTLWGLSYFFLILGKIPTFSYFFRFLLKLIDKNAIFEPKKFFCLALLGIISFSE